MPSIVYLCTDLLFTSKIREIAQALGHTAHGARDPLSLLAAARDHQPVIASVIDLRRPDALAALDALGADPTTAELPSVGFCDHERTEQMDEARRRGCTRVLTKGKLASDLARLLGAEPRAAG